MNNVWIKLTDDVCDQVRARITNQISSEARFLVSDFVTESNNEWMIFNQIYEEIRNQFSK